MSGRSAYARKGNVAKADKKHRQQESYGGYDENRDTLSRPTFSANASYVSSPRPRRRQSVSSTSSTYGYPPPSMRKPRPIIVASAIEKSDFRTHLDGMSATLRGKLGRMLRHGDDATNNNQHLPIRRPGTATASTDSDYTVPSTHFTPSLGAVPSLSPSTSPSDAASGYYSAHQSQSHTIRSKSQWQDNALHKIRSFEGGGKLPQLGWKSLSNVRPESRTLLCCTNSLPDAGAVGRARRYASIHVHEGIQNQAATFIPHQLKSCGSVWLETLH